MNGNLDERLMALLGTSEVVTRLDGRGKSFVITAAELLFVDETSVQRVELRHVSRVVVEKSGSILVSSPAGTAITTTIRDFDVTELKFFFEQVKGAIANAKGHVGPEGRPVAAQSFTTSNLSAGRLGAATAPAAELDIGGDPIPEGHETLIDGMRSETALPGAERLSAPPSPMNFSGGLASNALTTPPKPTSVLDPFRDHTAPQVNNPFADDPFGLNNLGQNPVATPESRTTESDLSGNSLTLTPVPPARPSAPSDYERGPRSATSTSVRTGERASGEVAPNSSAWDGDVLDPRASLESPSNMLSGALAARPNGGLVSMARWLRIMGFLCLIVGVAAGAVQASIAVKSLEWIMVAVWTIGGLFFLIVSLSLAALLQAWSALQMDVFALRRVTLGR